MFKADFRVFHVLCTPRWHAFSKVSLATLIRKRFSTWALVQLTSICDISGTARGSGGKETKGLHIRLTATASCAAYPSGKAGLSFVQDMSERLSEWTEILPEILCPWDWALWGSENNEVFYCLYPIDVAQLLRHWAFSFVLSNYMLFSKVKLYL